MWLGLKVMVVVVVVLSSFSRVVFVVRVRWCRLGWVMVIISSIGVSRFRLMVSVFSLGGSLCLMVMVLF